MWRCGSRLLYSGAPKNTCDNPTLQQSYHSYTHSALPRAGSQEGLTADHSAEAFAHCLLSSPTCSRSSCRAREQTCIGPASSCPQQQAAAAAGLASWPGTAAPHVATPPTQDQASPTGSPRSCLAWRLLQSRALPGQQALSGGVAAAPASTSATKWSGPTSHHPWP